MMAHVSSFSYFLILSVLLSCEEKDTLKDKKRKQERAILSLAASGRPTVLQRPFETPVRWYRSLLLSLGTQMINCGLGK